MTRRFGLALVGAVVSAATLPGCVHPQQHTVIDKSWSARDSGSVSTSDLNPPPQNQKWHKYWLNAEAGDTPKFVPPQVEPPPFRDPNPDEKPSNADPASFGKIPQKPDDPKLPGPGPNNARPPQEPLILALKSILDNRHPDALEHLKKYDPATQELFIRLLPLMAEASRKGLDKFSAAEVAAFQEVLLSLQSTIRTRTELAIDKICFCEAIKAFGVYKELPPNHAFTAGALNRPGDLVQLYAQLRNFASEPRGGGFETRLASTVEILDGQGRQVWFKNFEDNKKPYRSETQLHDYYNNYRFYVPHLPPGNYTLKLQIADESRPEARRTAAKTLDFRVATLPRAQ